MRREALKLIYDAREAGRLALSFVSGRTEADYMADVMLRSAVERQLFIAGEAISQLAQEDRDTFDSLPGARSIVGFRNLLAHGYNKVDNARVWDVLRHDLPRTLEDIERLKLEAP